MKAIANISARTILIVVWLTISVFLFVNGGKVIDLLTRGQQDLSALKIFQSTVSESKGTRLIVFSESGGVATPLLPFTIGNEQPTLFVQTELPGGNMQVTVADRSNSTRSLPVSDLFGPYGYKCYAYGTQRKGTFMILMETPGSGAAPPNRLYIAPAPTQTLQRTAPPPLSLSR